MMMNREKEKQMIKASLKNKERNWIKVGGK
jgi:hypothetical protein